MATTTIENSTYTIQVTISNTPVLTCVVTVKDVTTTLD